MGHGASSSPVALRGSALRRALRGAGAVEIDDPPAEEVANDAVDDAVNDDDPSVTACVLLDEEIEVPSSNGPCALRPRALARLLKQLSRLH